MLACKATVLGLVSSQESWDLRRMAISVIIFLLQMIHKLEEYKWLERYEDFSLATNLMSGPSPGEAGDVVEYII